MYTINVIDECDRRIKVITKLLELVTLFKRGFKYHEKFEFHFGLFRVRGKRRN